MAYKIQILDPDCTPRRYGTHQGVYTDLYSTWARIRPAKAGGRVAEWRQFIRFRADVGDRCATHHLVRPDRSRPWGPDNFRWEPGPPQSGALKHGRARGGVADPLYRQWSAAKQHGGVVPEWNDFESFFRAVGERPEGHSLARPDETRPFGPGNWLWHAMGGRKTATRIAERVIRSEADDYAGEPKEIA